MRKRRHSITNGSGLVPGLIGLIPTRSIRIHNVWSRGVEHPRSREGILIDYSARTGSTHSGSNDHNADESLHKPFHLRSPETNARESRTLRTLSETSLPQPRSRSSAPATHWRSIFRFHGLCLHFPTVQSNTLFDVEPRQLSPQIRFLAGDSAKWRRQPAQVPAVGRRIESNHQQWCHRHLWPLTSRTDHVVRVTPLPSMPHDCY